ncbi:MAG: hypothetical protein WAM26_03725, partial [Nitrososphaeraceae archaeon]
YIPSQRSLKDKFIIKICAIDIAMTCSLLLGASIYWQENFMAILGITFRWISVPVVGQMI